MKKQNNHSGQAMVTLLIFVSIAIVVITGTVIVIVSNTLSATVSQQSLLVGQAAENGVENALLRLLRDPTYAGETVSFNGFPTTITVSGSATDKTIISTVTTVNIQRKITARINYNNNIMSVTFWQDSQ